MQLKKASFSKAPFTTELKTACSVLALTACLIAGGVQAADQGPRHHARGQYDTVSATYTETKRAETKRETKRGQTTFSSFIGISH